MEQKPIIYDFNGNQIEFQLNGDKDVKVNATQMAKIFGKDVSNFLILKQTENFISSCLKTRNSGYLNVKNKADLITSKQKSGTYMHRILALKFAAWLNPDFEVWIYMTIERLIFGIFAEQKERLKKKAKNLIRIEELENELSANSAYKELINLQDKNEKAGRKSRSENSKQLNMFRDLFKK